MPGRCFPRTIQITLTGMETRQQGDGLESRPLGLATRARRGYSSQMRDRAAGTFGPFPGAFGHCSLTRPFAHWERGGNRRCAEQA